MRAGSIINATLIATLAVLSAALPAAAERFHDEARVIDTQPVYKARKVPLQTQKCGYEPAAIAAPVDPSVPGDARMVDPGIQLLGALQRDVQLREQPADVYRCRVVTHYESKEELVGYRVRYEHYGRVYERQMAEPPGATIRVAVQLSTASGR